MSLSQKQSWVLTDKEYIILSGLWAYIKQRGSVPITHLYNHIKQYGIYHKELRNDKTNRMYVKYLLMFLWKQNRIKIKCNNRLKIIYLNRAKLKKLSTISTKSS